MTQPNKRRNPDENRKDKDDLFVPEEYLKIARSWGNAPDDIAKWREERKRKFPRVKRSFSSATEPRSALTSLVSAYESDEEESSTPLGQQDVVKLQDQLEQGSQKLEPPSLVKTKRKLCKFYYQSGRCKYGSGCRDEHSKRKPDSSESAAAFSNRTLMHKLLDDVRKLHERCSVN